MTLPSPATLILGLAAGFACGSVPFGWFAGRLKGIEIRDHGSGNIGFTNVYRVLGPAWAVPVFLLDAAKGALPVLVGPLLGLDPRLCAAGAVLGHVYSPWLGFRGGKGVATAIGAGAALFTWSLLAGLGVYTLVLLTTGYISVASLVFAGSLPALTAICYPRDLPLLATTVFIALLIVFRHTANIRRLTDGTEPRFGLWERLFRRKR